MNIDRMMNVIAGSMIVLSVLLAVYHNINWLWFTGFIGLNLVQSAFTGFCPPAILLKKLGVKPGTHYS